MNQERIMLGKILLLSFSMYAAACLTGCSSKAGADAGSESSTAAPVKAPSGIEIPVAATPIIATPIIFEGSFTVTGPAKNRKIEVFRTQEAFNSELYNFIQPIKEHTVDFSRSQVVLLTMGSQPSPGYFEKVTEFEEFERYVKVSIVHVHPGDGCISATVMTDPWVFVEISSTKELVFEESIETKHCQ